MKCRPAWIGILLICFASACAPRDTHTLTIGEAELEVFQVSAKKDRPFAVHKYADLAEDRGVLVRYPSPRVHHFFSTDARVDFTVALLDAQGKILEVQNLVHGSKEGMTSVQEAPHVLLVHRGWAERHPLTVSAVVRMPESLKEVPIEEPYRIAVGSNTVSVELAMTNAERERGLMYRNRMSEGDGMLFLYPEAGERYFWMKNTILPLTLAYVRSDGTISSLHDLEPLNEQSVPSKEPVPYILEMNRGWFERHKVVPGDKIAIPDEIRQLPSERPE